MLDTLDFSLLFTRTQLLTTQLHIDVSLSVYSDFALGDLTMARVPNGMLALRLNSHSSS
jgi:hypothetical protein